MSSCATGLCEGKCKQTFKDGFWTSNPISIQMLGICSALAVTNRFENSLVMGAALIFVCAMSNLLVSILRNATPRRILPRKQNGLRRRTKQRRMADYCIRQ